MENINLMIHMDDMGMGYAANEAGINLFSRGLATSASIIVPGSWAYDFVRWSKQNPQFDVGIHLTHTCEWEAARWRPLSAAEDVPKILAQDGFMQKSLDSLDEKQDVLQYVTEAKRQIEQMIKWGHAPSHIDNHMWSFVRSCAGLEGYLALAEEYNSICHVPSWCIWDEQRQLIIDKFGRHAIESLKFSCDSDDMKSTERRFLEQLDGMKEGTYVWTIHPVIYTPEIQEIIPSWESRYWDFRFLIESNIIKKIKELGVRLVSWQDIRQQKLV